MAATGQVAGGLTAYDREVLTAVNAGEASLSFVGSGFIVLCYVLFKEPRKFSFNLVFYLALSDMLCSFFSMVGLIKGIENWIVSPRQVHLDNLTILSDSGSK